MTSGGLNVEVVEDDYDGLIGVMGHLMAIKDRQSSTDNMFEPLKQTIELLQSYDQVMPDEVHQQLEVTAWLLSLVCTHTYVLVHESSSLAWTGPNQHLLALQKQNPLFPSDRCCPVSYTHLTLPTIYSV